VQISPQPGTVPASVENAPVVAGASAAATTATMAIHDVRLLVRPDNRIIAARKRGAPTANAMRAVQSGG
jgi:hypothetical protein